jgi:hypothetical protein
MDVLIQVIQHYTVEIGVVVAIAIMSLLWRIWSTLLGSLFSPHKVLGKWETLMDRGAGFVRHEEVSLNQFIHFVWGTTVAQDGKRYGHRGTLIGDRLRMIYGAKTGGTDSGAMLLKVSASGEEMTGYEIGTDRMTDQIYAYPYKWLRRP